jgi:hypothetical protein
MTAYLLGLDLAQSQDYTALGVAEAIPPADRGGERGYHVRHLERLRGVSYVDIGAHVRDLAAVLRRPPPDAAHGRPTGSRPAATVVYDRTGVGAAVGDVLDRAEIDATLIGVTIHGGDRVACEAGIYRVPKRDLVSALIVAFQNGRLKIAADLALAPVLTKELTNFKLKLNPATMHDGYSAWREEDHDDLVLGLGMAVWYGERFAPPPAAVPYAAPHVSRWQRPVWSMPPRPFGERDRFR